MTANPASPQVSIILPTHNRAWCLRRAIRSVLEQTVRSWELVVVDDGSTDATAEVLREFPEVHPLRLEVNRGVSQARNAGVRRARGGLLCFLDSDDAWLPGKLAAQLDWMTRNPGAAACYTDEIWIRRGVRVNPMNKHRKYSGWILKHCLPLCLISPSSIMMRRRVWDAIGPFDETLPACEDYDLWLRLTARFPVHFLEQKLIVKYGGHGDQLSSRYWGMDRFRVRALEKLLATGELSPEQRGWVLDTLIEKCGILGTGFNRHGKPEDAERYYEAHRRYQQERRARQAQPCSAGTARP